MSTNRDLQPYKNKLMELSYNEKIAVSEWLHTQIELEMGDAVKEKMGQVGDKMNSFIDKAAKITKSTGNSLMDNFKDATK